MLREKRITKQPIPHDILYPEPKKQPNKGNKRHRKLQRCQFQMIPNPSKFIYPFKIMQLYGDVILVEKNNTITSELFALNKFKLFRNIEVKQNATNRLITVLVEQKEDFKMIPWKQTVKRLEASKEPEINSWATPIKNYCTKYEEFLADLESRNWKAARNEEEEIRYAKITAETNQRVAECFETYSTFQLKLRFRDNMMQVTEVVLNEPYLKELGYSLESFISDVFQEGIPQITSQGLENGKDGIKKFIEHYFEIPDEGIITPELDIGLIMKSTYVKEAKVVVHWLKNFEGGKYGVDIVATVINKKEPYLDRKGLPKKTLNKEFIQEMSEHEKTLTNFLTNFYDTSVTLRYTNFGKVCAVKELPRAKDDTGMHVEEKDH